VRGGTREVAGLSGAPYGFAAGRRSRAYSRCPRPDPLQLERARFEAGEALSALRRLQRRVSELEEESRLQDADVSCASLQSELAHSLDGDQGQDAKACGDAEVSSRPTRPLPVPSWRGTGSAPPSFSTRFHTALFNSFDVQSTLSLEAKEVSSSQPSAQEESLEPPKKRAPLSPAETLEEKEAEVSRLQDEVREGAWRWMQSSGRRPVLLSISTAQPLPTKPLIPGFPSISTILQSCFKSQPAHPPGRFPGLQPVPLHTHKPMHLPASLLQIYSPSFSFVVPHPAPA
jgi:hypothetical protein